MSLWIASPLALCRRRNAVLAKAMRFVRKDRSTKCSGMGPVGVKDKLRFLNDINRERDAKRLNAHLIRIGALFLAVLLAGLCFWQIAGVVFPGHSNLAQSQTAAPRQSSPFIEATANRVLRGKGASKYLFWWNDQRQNTDVRWQPSDAGWYRADYWLYEIDARPNGHACSVTLNGPQGTMLAPSSGMHDMGQTSTFLRNYAAE